MSIVVISVIPRVEFILLLLLLLLFVFWKRPQSFGIEYFVITNVVSAK
jgi:hypothetical protein